MIYTILYYINIKKINHLDSIDFNDKDIQKKIYIFYNMRK